VPLVRFDAPIFHNQEEGELVLTNFASNFETFLINSLLVESIEIV